MQHDDDAIHLHKGSNKERKPYQCAKYIYEEYLLTPKTANMQGEKVLEGGAYVWIVSTVAETNVWSTLLGKI